MTPPLSRHPTRLIGIMALAMIAVAVVLPFARRHDAWGWLSFSILAAVAVLFWSVLFVGALTAIGNWYRDQPQTAEDPRKGECYAEYVYHLCWNHESFWIRSRSGNILAEVSLGDAVRLLDIELLVTEGTVAVHTENKRIEFPRSRFERSKIIQLLTDVVRTSSEVQSALKFQHRRLTGQLVIWLPVALLTAAVLIWIAVRVPEPRVNALWAVVGFGYAGAWYFLIWRMGKLVACYVGTRTLRRILTARSQPPLPET